MAPAAAQVQPRTIVMVLPRDEQNIEAGFRDYLAKRNLPLKILTVRFSGRGEDGPALVAQVRRLAPDLVYSWGTGTTLALAGAHDAPNAGDFIRDVPIVFTEVTDPVGSKLVRQLDPPGRNVTGVSHVAPLPVQLNAMRNYRPFSRVGYIVNPKEPNTQLVLQSMRQLAAGMHFDIVAETVPLDPAGNPDPTALPAIVRRIAAQKVDFLYVPPSTFLAFTHRDLLTQAALEAKVPTFCSTESVVRQARCMFGLFSNGSNIGRFAAYKAVQVLADRTPVERIPAETLQRFSLLINMPTAKALQLYPPLGLLNVAEVIE
ncbi:ABC transporter substrate-binding protein [Ramlibacter sp.]|uniref:ABC transporter substrate-binding protein n=1 Tax=Ramlibacter sp. TaxID=1917967 RepID=UPI002D79E3D1|nr:ABC transporter substrate-binding protein [Ramlibacter sp.]